MRGGEIRTPFLSKYEKGRRFAGLKQIGGLNRT